MLDKQAKMQHNFTIPPGWRNPLRMSMEFRAVDYHVQGVGEDTYAASAGLRMSSVDFARKRAT